MAVCQYGIDKFLSYLFVLENELKMEYFLFSIWNKLFFSKNFNYIIVLRVLSKTNKLKYWRDWEKVRGKYTRFVTYNTSENAKLLVPSIDINKSASWILQVLRSPTENCDLLGLKPHTYLRSKRGFFFRKTKREKNVSVANETSEFFWPSAKTARWYVIRRDDRREYKCEFLKEYRIAVKILQIHSFQFLSLSCSNKFFLIIRNLTLL